jgi:hypothetical protein
MVGASNSLTHSFGATAAPPPPPAAIGFACLCIAYMLGAATTYSSLQCQVLFGVEF